MKKIVPSPHRSVPRMVTVSKVPKGSDAFPGRQRGSEKGALRLGQAFRESVGNGGRGRGPQMLRKGAAGRATRVQPSEGYDMSLPISWSKGIEG